MVRPADTGGLQLPRLLRGYVPGVDTDGDMVRNGPDGGVHQFHEVIEIEVVDGHQGHRLHIIMGGHVLQILPQDMRRHHVIIRSRGADRESAETAVRDAGACDDTDLHTDAAGVSVPLAHHPVRGIDDETGLLGVGIVTEHADAILPVQTTCLHRSAAGFHHFHVHTTHNATYVFLTLRDAPIGRDECMDTIDWIIHPIIRKTVFDFH